MKPVARTANVGAIFAKERLHGDSTHEVNQHESDRS